MKNKWSSDLGIFIAVVLMIICGCKAQPVVKIQFDSNKEVSGKKFALRDISPGLPMINGKFHFGTVDRALSLISGTYKSIYNLTICHFKN